MATAAVDLRALREARGERREAFLQAQAVGPHPLFNGIRAVTIGGIPTEPELTGDGDGWIIRAEGVHGHFQAATIHQDASTVTVTLRS